ncbi:MAG: dipeptide epimerase [Pseudomonadota bacterium]
MVINNSPETPPGKVISTNIVRCKLTRPFTTARGTRTEQRLLKVQISAGGHIGRGETAGVAYDGETVEGLTSQIEGRKEALSKCLSREALLDILPPGGARAAIDAAFWDLEAKITGQSVSQQLGRTAPPQNVMTAFTISLDTPAAMAAQTQDEAHRPLLKVKLGGRDGIDIARATAVRENAPDARLVADGNGGFTPDTIHETALALRELNYELFEQPLLHGQDAFLDDYTSPLPLCADESLASLDDLELVARRYTIGNIKLDKCGGLTHGLELQKGLRERNMGVFIGTMLTGSMSVVPALHLAQGADYIDLDTPMWIIEEDVPPLSQDGIKLTAPDAGFWGTPT